MWLLFDIYSDKIGVLQTWTDIFLKNELVRAVLAKKFIEENANNVSGIWIAHIQCVMQ